MLKRERLAVELVLEFKMVVVVAIKRVALDQMMVASSDTMSALAACPGNGLGVRS